MECVSPAAGPSPARATILVVEDEVLARLTLADELRDRGWSVVEAADADEALRVLDGGVPVDLVVTDIRMPGTVDGVGLAQRLRRRFPQVRILIVSGEPPTAEARAACDGYVEKPYGFDRLLERIVGLLA